ncbi:MAG: hypothetical protein JWQ38_2407 [Flavipsychrobacter sp.]|nr:hypothetical protein [Flavipsychrobacter sp.]
MNNILFHESQHMVSSLPATGIIAFLVCFVIYAIKNKRKVNRVLSVIIILIAAVIVSILITLRLDTIYYTDRVEFQFVSVYSAPYEVVSLDSVSKVSVISYGMHEFGGWGVKGNEDTKAYLASGDKGVMFTFKSGKHLVLGTHLPDEIAASLKGHYPL